MFRYKKLFYYVVGGRRLADPQTGMGIRLLTCLTAVPSFLGAMEGEEGWGSNEDTDVVVGPTRSLLFYPYPDHRARTQVLTLRLPKTV